MRKRYVLLQFNMYVFAIKLTILKPKNINLLNQKILIQRRLSVALSRSKINYFISRKLMKDNSSNPFLNLGSNKNNLPHHLNFNESLYKIPILSTQSPYFDSDYYRLNMMLQKHDLKKINLVNPSQTDLNDIFKVIQKLAKMYDESKEVIQRLHTDLKHFSEKCEKSDLSALQLETRIKNMEYVQKQNEQLMIQQKVQDAKKINFLQKLLEREKELSKSLQVKFNTQYQKQELQRMFQMCKNLVKFQSKEEDQTHFLKQKVELITVQIQTQDAITTQQSTQTISTEQNFCNTDNYFYQIQRALDEAMRKLFIITKCMNDHLLSVGYPEATIDLIGEMDQELINQQVCLYHAHLSKVFDAQRQTWAEQCIEIHNQLVIDMQKIQNYHRQSNEVIEYICRFAFESLESIRTQCGIRLELNQRLRIDSERYNQPDLSRQHLQNVQQAINSFLESKEEIKRQIQQQTYDDETKTRLLNEKLVQSVIQHQQLIKIYETEKERFIRIFEEQIEEMESQKDIVVEEGMAREIEG